MGERPPIADIDYTAAVEAAAKALCHLHTDHVDRWQDWAAEGAAAVDAVWPILHAAAYGAGRASILDGAEEEFAFNNGGFIIPITPQDATGLKSPANRAQLLHAWRTEWQPVETEAGDG